MKPGQKNWLEWVVFGIGLVLVLGVLGLLTFEMLQAPQPDQHIEVRTGEPQAAAGTWLVPVFVSNHARQSFAQVLVTIELDIPGQPPEQRELTFHWLPAETTLEGAVSSTTRPASPPRSWLVSYHLP